jgi:alkyl hydroperoxide reductase subunit D
VLVSAVASRNADVIRAAEAGAAAHLTEAALNAVRAANSIMAMNNIYYRFTHLVGHENYQQMPARLRMSVIGNPGVDKTDFELWSLAVSAINGCGRCIEAHEAELVKRGTSREQIQDVVRIAAIIHAVAVTLEAEAARPGQTAAAA